MRLLFIAPLPDPVTGQSLASQVLLDALRQVADVDVINLSKPGFAQGADSYRRLGQVISVLWRVSRGRWRADAIYLTIAESRAGNAKDLAIFLLCLGKLRRLTVHLHGGAGLRELLGRRHPITRALNAWFLRRMGAVIVLGSRHLPIFEGLADPRRLHIVPNFAPDEMFVEPGAIEAKFASVVPLRLLFVSNLLPGKGHMELLSAYKSLDAACKASIRLDFAGGFETEGDRTAFIRQIADERSITYHGIVRGTEKIQLFQRAHVFCLPTCYPYEGQPISILEAYAAGCAVVTTDHSGIFDVFKDGENGYAVDKGSVSDLASVMMRALAEIGFLRNAAANNRQIADAAYRSSDFTRKIFQVLSQFGQSA